MKCLALALLAYVLLDDQLCLAGKLLNTRCGNPKFTPRVPKEVLKGTNPKQRIVGGKEAKPHSYPWIVSLRKGPKTHLCGGSLLRVSDTDESDIVLTAAHCFDEPITDPHVILGNHIAEKPAKGEEKVKVADKVVHEKYDREWMFNDIAIIKLEKPVKFSNTISPICLPEKGAELADGRVGIVAGWGVTNEFSMVPSSILMEVTMPTVNWKLCNDSYKTSTYPTVIKPEYMFCAGHKTGGKDSCQGDSGGPIIFQDGNTFVQYGAVSFGDGCAQEHKYGVYVHLSKYIDWINQQVQALSAVN